MNDSPRERHAIFKTEKDPASGNRQCSGRTHKKSAWPNFIEENQIEKGADGLVADQDTGRIGNMSKYRIELARVGIFQSSAGGCIDRIDSITIDGDYKRS